jgi:hypothetical protein
MYFVLATKRYPELDKTAPVEVLHYPNKPAAKRAKKALEQKVVRIKNVWVDSRKTFDYASKYRRVIIRPIKFSKA